MEVKYIAIIISSLILLLVVELIRREKLTFKYAFSWLLASLAAIGFSVYDEALIIVSDLFGFELPSNFIFFGVMAGLVLMSLLMTIFLCQQSRRNDAIAQKMAVLEFNLEQLKKDKPRK